MISSKLADASASQGARVTVVGGGITGLSAAWELARAGADVVVLEAAGQPGGVIAGETADGFILEHGAEGFLTSKRVASELCAEVGVEAELVGNLPSPVGARILHNGRLEPLPKGWRMIEPGELQPVLDSPLFTPEVKQSLAEHWDREPPAAAGEESIAAYLRRRWGPLAGQAIADTVAGPMMGGVYGGSPEKLTLETVRPRQARTSTATAGGAAKPGQAPQPPASLFTTLRGGMSELIAAMVRQLPAGSVRCQTAVRRVRAQGDGYALELAEGEPVSASSVILALPAWAAAECLLELDQGLAQRLAAFPYASSVSVNLGYRTSPALPAGSGFLVPRGAGYRLAACTFAHQKFPGRAPAGGGLIRAFYDEATASQADAEIAALAQQELRNILGISAAPDLLRLHRHQRSMPQYNVGHGEQVAALGPGMTRWPGLHLAGNVYQGPGVPDCIASGREAARACLVEGQAGRAHSA